MHFRVSKDIIGCYAKSHFEGVWLCPIKKTEGMRVKMKSNLTVHPSFLVDKT